MFASQVMNASIVAMFGCIIPEPFATPAVVTISLSNVSVTTHVFVSLSVVNIDFAKSSALPLITSFENHFQEYSLASFHR